jgi:branched-chain amino acid aminotransferase
VGSVDRRPLGDGAIGAVTARLKEHFVNVVHGRVPERQDWLTPVWS